MNLTAKFPGRRFARTAASAPVFFRAALDLRGGARRARPPLRRDEAGIGGVLRRPRSLSSDPRWRNGSIYLFGLDTHGNPLFSGDPYSRWYGGLAPELNGYLGGPFGGRDVVSVGDAFGESFLYYSARDPSTGMTQRKVTFVKRVVAYGLAILVGSGYYLDEGP